MTLLFLCSASFLKVGPINRYCPETTLQYFTTNGMVKQIQINLFCIAQLRNPAIQDGEQTVRNIPTRMLVKSKMDASACTLLLTQGSAPQRFKFVRLGIT